MDNKLICSFDYRYIVMTTSGGIMDHEEARRKHLGGKILGFFFWTLYAMYKRLKYTWSYDQH